MLVIAGLFVPQPQLAHLTRNFLQIKRQFNPGFAPAGAHWLDLAKTEIKGADLRHDLRHAGRNRRRAVNRFLDKVIQLLEDTGAQLVARIYVKGPGCRFDGRAVYTSSVQSLCATFQHFLAAKDSRGFMVADSRTPALNSTVSHSVFTQKFKATGDA
ncbi:cobyric acid synthase, partial [mine drainage metagenome]